MLKPRTPFLVSLLAGVVALIIAKPVVAALKAVFDVTVQDFWKEAIAPYLSAQVGPWSTTMLEAIGPFWLGFGSAFLLMFVVEMVFAWWRSHVPSADTATAPETLSNANVLPPQAGVIIETSMMNLPNVFPESGFIDSIDFVPKMRYLDVRRGSPGDALSFLPDELEISFAYRFRINLVTSPSIFGVQIPFHTEYRSSAETQRGSGHFVSGPPDYSEIKNHEIGRLEPDKPHDIWFYTQTNAHVFIAIAGVITCSEIGVPHRREVQIVSQKGNNVTLGPTIRGVDPSPLWRSKPVAEKLP